jgi:hypothetical protein
MKTIQTLICLVLLTGAAYAQPALKAMYIYNFCSQTEYPAEYRSGDFVVGVLGSSPVYDELQKIAQSKKVGTQTMVVKSFSSASSVSKCHLLFISEDQSGSLSKVMISIGSANTLIVGEKEGLCKEGASMNFVLRDQKLKFELSSPNMEKRGLKPTSYLEKLAIPVN